MAASRLSEYEKPPTGSAGDANHMSAMSDEALCVVVGCVAVGMSVASVTRLMAVAVWSMRMCLPVSLVVTLHVI